MIQPTPKPPQVKASELEQAEEPKADARLLDNIVPRGTPVSSRAAAEAHTAPVVDTVNELLKTRNNVETVGDSKVVDFSSMTEYEAYRSEAIVARPVMLPNELEFTVTHSEYAYRWFHFNNKDNKRFFDAQHMGFVKATAEDVSMLNTAAVTPDGIIHGDLILMKMRKEQYYGLLKFNALRALAVHSREAQAKLAAVVAAKHGLSGGNRGASDVRRHGGVQDRVEMYIPDERELARAGAATQEIAVR